MTESAFVTVNNIIAEQTNVVEELSIIAKDERHLKAADRDALIRGADELETAQRSCAFVYAALLDTQRQLAAVSEKLTEVRAENARSHSLPSLSLKIGPTPLIHTAGFGK